MMDLPQWDILVETTPIVASFLHLRDLRTIACINKEFAEKVKNILSVTHTRDHVIVKRHTKLQCKETKLTLVNERTYSLEINSIICEKPSMAKLVLLRPFSFVMSRFTGMVRMEEFAIMRSYVRVIYVVDSFIIADARICLTNRANCAVYQPGCRLCTVIDWIDAIASPTLDEAPVPVKESERWSRDLYAVVNACKRKYPACIDFAQSAELENFLRSVPSCGAM